MKKILNEATKSSNLAFLIKKLKNQGSGTNNFGPTLFKFMGGVKLDQLTNNEVFKDSPGSVMKYARKNAIIFYFDATMKFLGATQGKKQIMSDYGRWTLEKKSGRSRNDRIGQNTGNVDTHQPDFSKWADNHYKATGTRPTKKKWGVISPKTFKALRDASKTIYVVELDGNNLGVKDTQISRSNAREGATALKDMRSIAKENANRYREILKSRTGGKDEVDKQVGKATTHFAKLAVNTKVVETSYGGRSELRLYVGRSDNSQFKRGSFNYVSLDDITNVLSRMMSSYRRYVEKQLEIDMTKERIAKNPDPDTQAYSDRWIERDESSNKDRALDIKKYTEQLLSITPLK